MQYVITNVHGSAKAVHLPLGFVNRARRKVMISSIKLRTLFCAALGFNLKSTLLYLRLSQRCSGRPTGSKQKKRLRCRLK